MHLDRLHGRVEALHAERERGRQLSAPPRRELAGAEPPQRADAHLDERIRDGAVRAPVRPRTSRALDPAQDLLARVRVEDGERAPPGPLVPPLDAVAPVRPAQLETQVCGDAGGQGAEVGVPDVAGVCPTGGRALRVAATGDGSGGTV